MSKHRHSTLLSIVVTVVAVAVALGAFYLIYSRHLLDTTEADLREWSAVVREELENPMPDPARLTRLAQDPHTGEPTVGIMVLDAAGRISVTNRPDLFAAGETAHGIVSEVENLHRFQRNGTPILLLYRPLMAASAGSGYAVFAEEPSVDLAPEGPIPALVMAILIGILATRVGDFLVAPDDDAPDATAAEGSDEPGAPGPGEPPGLDPELLGELSREIYGLTRTIGELEEEADGTVDSERRRHLEERAAELRVVAGDLATLSELSGYTPAPTEAFAVQAMLEEVVHDHWADLTRLGVEVALPATGLRIEGDILGFSRAMGGILRYLAPRGKKIAVRASLRGSLVTISARASGEPPGGPAAEPTLRGRLGLEITRTVARIHGGELLRGGENEEIMAIRVPQWRK